MGKIGIHKSYKHQFHLKNACLKKHQKKLDKINEEAFINEKTTTNDETTTNKETTINKETITNKEATINKKASKKLQLVSVIQQLSDKKLSSISNLISLMQYPKSSNEGKIISSYLQQKAYNYLIQSLYNLNWIINHYKIRAKAHHIQNQKSKHITEIHLLVSHLKIISDKEFQKK
ncbi:694_t:CDS:2, partial [Cetraspora pellucida]